MSGWEVIASYRDLGPTMTDYVVVERKRYSWRWWAWLANAGTFCVVRRTPEGGWTIIKQEIVKVPA